MASFHKGSLVVCFVILSRVASGQVVNTGFADSSGGIRLGNEQWVLGAQLDLYRNWSRSPVREIPHLVSASSLHQWSINLAFLDLRYRGSQIRSRLMPSFGSYMERNYSPGEPRLLEASLGYKPWKNRDLWVDAGLLGSPFTNESPVSRDQPTYTRSLSAEFVPYYLSGVRIGYTWGPKLSTYLYGVNGWQQAIDKVRGQAVVIQAEFRPADKILINVNFIRGQEQHATQRQTDTSKPQVGMRILWDAYVIWRPTPKFLLTSSFYHGNQNKNRWNQANLILEKTWNPSWSGNLRLEILNDPAGVVLPRTLETQSGIFQGYSCGFKYKVQEHLFLRSEFRHLYRTLIAGGSESWPYWTLSASIGL